MLVYYYMCTGDVFSCVSICVHVCVKMQTGVHVCICDTCLCRDTYIDVQVGGWGAVFWDIAHLNFRSTISILLIFRR